MPTSGAIKIYFSDYFGVSRNELDEAGAFDVSLINDLPLFIDPFLLFNSHRPEYKRLHDEMIRYLRFLRDKSVDGELDDGLLRAWFMFSEVRQTWLGFSESGNDGRGLGMDFARALNANLNKVFTNFGNEQVTKGSHLEKLCLIGSGVGRDNISDFTTNLIKEYLLDYTQAFAKKHIRRGFKRVVTVEKVRFKYETETWERGSYTLPYFNGDYVLLTPADILTRDETWINRYDMVHDFERIAVAVPDEQLRAQINNYFMKHLPKRPTPKDRRELAARIYREFPELLEYYIRYKEDNGDQAVATSEEQVTETKLLYIEQLEEFVRVLNRLTGFYGTTGTTLEESRARVMFLKDVIENKGGHRLFYLNGQPVRREPDLHILFRLTWFATPSDVSREVNDGRGPADFKVSRGSLDKTLVEFKLASNPQLERNLKNQVSIYQKASDAKNALKVIVFFSSSERVRVTEILRKLKLKTNPDIILIDARRDNKPSASKATSVEPSD